MADAIISVVAERLTSIVAEQIRNEVNLVRGVEKEVLDLSYKLKKVRNVLDDADRRGFSDKSIKQWLKRLEDASYEMDDVLDEWNISLLKLQIEQRDSSKAPPKHKACPFIPYSSCLCFKKVATRRDIAMKIKNVKAKLDEILEEEKQYSFLKNQGADSSNRLERVTTSFVEVAEVKGRDEDMDRLVSKLITDSAGASQEDQLGPIHMTSIVGTGGIGKTTLAQLVYNDNRVEDCFPLRIWICVSDPFDEAKIAKEIVEQVQKSTPSTNQLEMLLKFVTDSVSGKKFLLVLDDVWTGEDSKWGRLKNSLKHGAVGSSVLVTTRNERVAIMMGTTENKIHRLGLLSDEDCWLLLHRIAFFGRNEEKELLDIGRKIANKCKGLPLAAKVLGSLLRFKNTVEGWENVLNCTETWQLEEAKEDIFPHLALSYNELSPAQKRCFSYCAVFPKDHMIKVDKLIRNWMALGYLSSNGNLESDLELRGREYFDNLAMRSLFQEFEKDNFTGQITECKMHDIVHDFCQFLRKSDDLKSSGSGVEAMMLKKTSGCEVCGPLLVSSIKEYRSLFFQKTLLSLHICHCHTSLRVFSLSGCGLQSVPTEIEKLIHLRDLDLSENKLSGEDLKSICKIYNLQSLLLRLCELVEIPTEIGYLVQLRHLDLSSNELVRKLPESICDLHELRILNVRFCNGLSELPQGIHNLVNLKVLSNRFTVCLNQYPQGLAELIGLQELDKFCGGRDWSRFGLLKKLNRLSGLLQLKIRLANLDEEVVEDAREAELVKKIHIQYLRITFVDDKADEKEEPLCMDVLDALRPHTNLYSLSVRGFKGSKLPRWIFSPPYQLRQIGLWNADYCSSLPPFGLLPCLEVLLIWGMRGLEFVGREFLGITSSSMASSSSTSSISTMLIGFPKLKKLTFFNCPNWEEWEDITAEEEQESTILSVLPCLTELYVQCCPALAVLPRRLLRKAVLLEKLELTGSTLTQVIKRYEDSEDPLISHIPRIIYR